jgi:hypothetical protein
LRHHARAEPAAELDATPGFVAEHVLHQERHAPERAAAERGFVQVLDAVRVGLDDRVQRRVHLGDRRGRSGGKFTRRDLAAVNQPGQPQRVMARVFVESHGISFLSQRQGVQCVVAADDGGALQCQIAARKKDACFFLATTETRRLAPQSSLP